MASRDRQRGSKFEARRWNIYTSDLLPLKELSVSHETALLNQVVALLTQWNANINSRAASRSRNCHFKWNRGKHRAVEFSTAAHLRMKVFWGWILCDLSTRTSWPPATWREFGAPVREVAPTSPVWARKKREKHGYCHTNTLKEVEREACRDFHISRSSSSSLARVLQCWLRRFSTVFVPVSS